MKATVVVTVACDEADLEDLRERAEDECNVDDAETLDYPDLVLALVSGTVTSNFEYDGLPVVVSCEKAD